MTSDTTAGRAITAQAVIQQLPPSIRASLLDDASFCVEYGLRADATLSIGDSGVAVRRSTLLNAVRQLLSGLSELKVTDTENQEWKVSYQPFGGRSSALLMSKDERRLVLPDFSVLSPTCAVRLASLAEAAADLNLPSDAVGMWRAILEQRPLEDSEVDNYFSDLRDTPVHVERSIGALAEDKEVTLSALVPSSKRYFSRLVGKYDGSSTVEGYAQGVGRKLLTQLISWHPYKGFLNSLLLCSHSAFAKVIEVDAVSVEDLTAAFSFLKEQGDRLSQVGAVEVALRILPKRPELEPLLIELVKQIRDDSVEEFLDGMRLFSALFVLVDGELSRRRQMIEEPPFYRRLASMAHAALIARRLQVAEIDATFCDWAIEARGEQFYTQCLTDLRREPRWHPDMASASQLKMDFFGRIIGAAATRIDPTESGGRLYKIILSAEADSLRSLGEFPYPYLPGPLEGAENTSVEIPKDLAGAIEEQLDTRDEVEPSAFIGLVNSARIFRLPAGQAELAVKALRMGNYRLSKVEDKSQLLAILNGLGTVAAVTRSTALADELRIIVRRYRRDREFRLSIDEAVSLCLIAAGSRASLVDWCDFTGDWLTELAFGELEDVEGRLFASRLDALLLSVAELWVSCAKADAALRAYNASRPKY